VVGAEYGQKFSDGLAISLNYKGCRSLVLSKSGHRTPTLLLRSGGQAWLKLDFVTGFISNTNNSSTTGALAQPWW
jgi:hypothetical protein